MAAKVTYDLTSTPKIIRVNNSITELDVQVDLYSDGKEDWQSDLLLAGIDFPYRTVGGDPLTADKSITPKFFLASGWILKPYEGSHELAINGDLFSDVAPPDPLVMATSGAFTVNVLFNRSFDAITTVVHSSGFSGTVVDTDSLGMDWSFQNGN